MLRTTGAGTIVFRANGTYLETLANGTTTGTWSQGNAVVLGPVGGPAIGLQGRRRLPGLGGVQVIALQSFQTPADEHYVTSFKTIAAGIIAAGIIAAGCSTAQRPEAETVGTITSIDGSSYRKAVHSTTDLSTPALVTPGTVGNADDNGFQVKGGAAPELPEVAPKSDGLTVTPAPELPEVAPKSDGLTVTPAPELPEVAPKSDGLSLGTVRQ